MYIYFLLIYLLSLSFCVCFLAFFLHVILFLFLLLCCYVLNVCENKSNSVSGMKTKKKLFLVLPYWFFFLPLFQPVWVTLALFRFALFPRLSTWQPWRLGTPAKVLSLFYPLGRLEHIKTVLMGTNTPHTCIPGLVWQKQARPFSQFELKVGELGFPIHFVCVCEALYHRGHAAAIFPLWWWIRSIGQSSLTRSLPRDVYIRRENDALREMWLDDRQVGRPEFSWKSS